MRAARSSIERVMKAQFDYKILNEPLALDIYAENPFRILGVSGQIGRQETEEKIQDFRIKYPLGLWKDSVQLGYPVGGLNGDILERIDSLTKPKFRILNELFWFQIPEPDFVRLKEKGVFTDPTAVTVISEIGNGDQNGVMKHAAAIIYLNCAIGDEFRYLVSLDKSSGTEIDAKPDIQDQTAGNWQIAVESWELAHNSWAEAIKSDALWKHFAKRIETLNHPEIKPEDISEIRSDLPRALLAFNAALARHYASAHMGEYDSARQHLNIIKNSHYDEATVKEVLTKTVRSIAVNRLQPTVNKCNEKLSDSTSVPSYSMLHQIGLEIIEEASKVKDFLSRDLGFSDELVECCDFDRLCSVIMEAGNKVVEKAAGERSKATGSTSKISAHLKACQVCLMLVNKCLQLPVSSNMRRKMEKEKQTHYNMLCSGFKPKEEVEPARCWFIEEHYEDADPDASMLVSIHKVTGRTVVGYGQVSISYNTRYIFVPCSKRAQDHHSGKKKVVPRELSEDELSESGKKALVDIRMLEQDGLTAIQELEKKQDEEIRKIRADGEKEALDLKSQKKEMEEQAKEQAAKVRRSTRGLNSWWRFELPFLLFLFVSYAIGVTFTPYISMGDPILWPLIPVIPLLAGQVSRSLKRRSASRMVTNVGSSLDKEVFRAKQRYEKSINSIEAGYKKQISDTKSTAAKKIDSLRKQIQSKISCKPASANTSYPVYRQAMSEGYSLGSQPSG